MDSLDILFMAPRIPWPLDTGGKIRTFYLLRALSRRHRVKLLTFRDRQASTAEGLRQLQDAGVRYELFARPGVLSRARSLVSGTLGPLPIVVRKYQDATMMRRVHELSRGGQVQVVHCDHVHMAPYGSASPAPFVMDEHNVESMIWERFSKDDAEPMHKRLVFKQQAFLLRRLEARLAAESSLVTLCSEADQAALRELCGAPAPRTRVVPNGVDLGYFAASGPVEMSDHVFFTGSMDWAPNENAVHTFLDEIWPEVRRRLPGLEFAVVGRNPSQALQGRARAGEITVTGTVPDVRPYMREALGLLVPMRVGGGTRLKILEAFAARVPVISTALGIEGIDAVPDEHYLRAETPGEFADQIQRLRSDLQLKNEMVEAAHERVSSRYSWDAIGGRLAEVYLEQFARNE